MLKEIKSMFNLYKVRKVIYTTNIKEQSISSNSLFYFPNYPSFIPSFYFPNCPLYPVYDSDSWLPVYDLDSWPVLMLHKLE